MQHVIVMQNGMKAMWKWRGMALKVSILRLRKQCPEEKGDRNVRKEKKKKKGRRHTHFCCPSTGPASSGRGPCAVPPKAEINQTEIQRAWGSLLALLLGDVWLYGLLHATGNIAVDLATNPL